MGWSIVAKAADRSRRVSAVTLPFPILSKTSFSTFKSAASVECNLLYADCKLLDIEFDSMWESRREATTFSNIFDIKLRFETGWQFFSSFLSRVFFSRGLIYAFLNWSGKTTSWRDLLMILVLDSIRTSRQFFSKLVGNGSR